MAFYEEADGPAKRKFWHGKGCNFCSDTGYQDRIGIFELLQVTPEMKRLSEANFQTAWGGIAGLSLALPVMWTEASARGFTLADIARWMAEGPARLAGCDLRKGRIAKGFDADIVVFQPEAEFIATEQHLHYRHRASPYLAETLRGLVKATYLRGDCVFSDGEFPGGPRGREFHR